VGGGAELAEAAAALAPPPAETAGQPPAQEQPQEPTAEPEPQPEPEPEPQAPPVVRRLRLLGDPSLVCGEEALGLLTDLISVYKLESIEIPAAGAPDASGGWADREVGVTEAAARWAAEGVTLSRAPATPL